MAKATGPLFSLEASGTIGKTVTYSRWKGRPYVRARVIPLNPFDPDQVIARNRIRCTGPAQFWANHTADVLDNETLTDEARIRLITPDGYAWNGFLVDKMIGEGAVDYDAAAAIWTGLASGEKTAWDVAAAGLTPPIDQVAQGKAGGGFDTPLRAGDVFLHYMYGLYKMALYTLPDATPPVYA